MSGFFVSFALPFEKPFSIPIMKKLFIVIALFTLLCACNNNTQTPANVPQPDPATAAMHEKQQKAQEDWKNWDNLTDERKNELLEDYKATYDEIKAIKEAREARKAKFEAAMQNWDNLTLEEKKAAIDLMAPNSAKAEPVTTPEQNTK